MKKVVKKSPVKKVVKNTPIKKMANGGKSKSKPKTYEETGHITTVKDKFKNYKKDIVVAKDGTGNLIVHKDGKRSQFTLTKDQVEKQRAIAKKEAGYRKGGTAKMKKMELGGMSEEMMVSGDPGRGKKKKKVKLGTGRVVRKTSFSQCHTRNT